MSGVTPRMTALAMLIGSQGCATTSLGRDTLTFSRAGQLQRDVREFAAVRHALPDSLDELCNFVGGCRSSGRQWTDGWGNKFVYQREGTRFEIRSAWTDQTLFTADDLIAPSDLESEFVTRMAGCYQMSNLAMQGSAILTLSADPVGQGKYRSRSEANGEGVWYRVGETLLVELAGGSHVTFMILQSSDDSLSGYAESSHLRRQPVRGIKVECPTSARLDGKIDRIAFSPR